MTATETKNKKKKAARPAGEPPTSGPVTGSAGPERLESVRAAIAAAEKKREKIDSWDRDKLDKADHALAALRGQLAVAELEAMPLPARVPSTLKFEERDVTIKTIRRTGNHRERMDESATIRLARTLAVLGLQQRIGVKETGDGTFQLIFGDRRLTAAESIGWTEIPAKVYPPTLTDAEVEIIRTVENFGREDLTHVERAIAVARVLESIERTLARPEAFVGGERHGRPDHAAAVDSAESLQRAIDAAGGIEEYVGRQLGFPAKWVRDNAYVSRLGGEARALLSAHRIDVGHARELAKLGDPAVADLIARIVARNEQGLGGRDVNYCRLQVTERLRSLKVVPWRLDVAFGGGKPDCTGQACATCKFNSRSDPDLFGGALADEPEAGVCTNEGCFKAKQEIVEKDLAKVVEKAEKKLKKLDAPVTEAFVQEFVPIYVKAATAARRAKKELEPAGEKSAAVATSLPHKPTPEEKATSKADEARRQWIRAAQNAVVGALTQWPARLTAAAVLGLLPPFDDDRPLTPEQIAANRGVLESAVRASDADIAAIATAVVKESDPEEWRNKLPMLDFWVSAELLEVFTSGWNLGLPPIPTTADFMPAPKKTGPTAKPADTPSAKPPATPAAAPAAKSAAYVKRQMVYEASNADTDKLVGLLIGINDGTYPGTPAQNAARARTARAELCVRLSVPDDRLDEELNRRCHIGVPGPEAPPAATPAATHTVPPPSGPVPTSPAAQKLPARQKHYKFDDEVADVLRTQINCTGNLAVIKPPRLGPKLYKRVDKALQLLGGKWTAGHIQAHVFPEPPGPLIEAAVTNGSVLDRKQTFQFFETPDDLAVRMVALAGIGPGMLVLEPSAGRGAIARKIRLAEPEADLECVELDRQNVEILRAAGFSTLECDFLEFNVDSSGFVGPFSFDQIVMNPPFSGGQDCRHVCHAFRMLRPGGRLVAIVGDGAFSKTTYITKVFQELYAEYSVSEETLQAGTFAESGTDVVTHLVVLEKPSVGAA